MLTLILNLALGGDNSYIGEIDPVAFQYLLLEDASFFLLEDSSNMMLES